MSSSNSVTPTVDKDAYIAHLREERDAAVRQAALIRYERDLLQEEVVAAVHELGNVLYPMRTNVEKLPTDTELRDGLTTKDRVRHACDRLVVVTARLGALGRVTGQDPHPEDGIPRGPFTAEPYGVPGVYRIYSGRREGRAGLHVCTVTASEDGFWQGAATVIVRALNLQLFPWKSSVPEGG